MNQPALQKTLSAIHLWAISVGLVISGEYFGWNYGWGAAGTVGFLIVTLVVTLLYITFVFSFTELTTAIPNAGGPFAYAHKAFGPWGGLVAGYATVVEFVFATPAIAAALGSYVHFLYPAITPLVAAVICYIVFSCINLLGIKESAMFSLVVTLLAVVELLIFMGIVAPAFSFENFTRHAFPLRWGGLFAALPFAIWFYLAIEGVAMVAEEVKDPQRHIPRGYIAGIVTLTVLALGVMILTGGIGDWRTLSNIDYPLPEAIGLVLGKDNTITRLFAGIGLFGLIASFHGIIISYSRQLFALARAGFLPGVLATVNRRFKTPHAALLAGGGAGMLMLFFANTGQIIILSALGAVVMYIISMVSLFQLRRIAPDLARPFKTPFYPIFPGTALVLSVVSLLSIVYYNPFISLLFLGGLILTILVFWASGRALRTPVETGSQHHELS
ncbi:ethanolamine permease [Parachryseolinea silvisoli]|jgi:ethanolamine permease|uniref:ethanolamine permease n=1 Tax=Parachryseolinea silvisoli TaxID=2873601 RepID=UPI002265F11D|nr:ethanolamine permease [Parachryseolinea silvisoli]MCD9015664.1 ethanolamine permease [Parachryseolinea silvisoli]